MSARLRFGEITDIALGDTGKSCGFSRLSFVSADRAVPTPFYSGPGRPGDLLLIIGHYLYADEAATVALTPPTGWSYMVSGSPVWWRWADGSATDIVSGSTTGGVMLASVRGAAPAGTASGHGGSPLHSISDGTMNNSGPNWTVDMSAHTIRNRLSEATADLLVGGLSIIYCLGYSSVYGFYGTHPGWPQPDASEYVAPDDPIFGGNPYFAVMFNDPWYATHAWPRTAMFCARPLDTTDWTGPRFDGIGNASFFDDARIYIGWITVQPWWNAADATVELDGAEVVVPMAVDSSPAVGDTLWVAQEGRRMYGIGHTPAPTE